MFWEPLGQRGCRGPVNSAGKEWTGLCRKGCPLRHTRGLGARTLNMLKNMVALVRDSNNKVIRRSSKTDREESPGGILCCQFDLFVWSMLILSGNNSPRVKF